MTSTRYKILGDFQTPVPLAEKVCKLILDSGYEPEVIVEPTCGRGNFIVAACNTFPRGFDCYCMDVQPEYREQFDENTKGAREKCNIHFLTGNVLEREFPVDEFRHRDVLVLGNLPWVTNAGLTALGAANPVRKGNYNALKGLDALTGRSNFDIAEAIIMHLIGEFSRMNVRMALICKFIVARNLIRDGERRGLQISRATWYELDARREFNVAAHAGVLDVSTGSPPSWTCEARFLDAPSVLARRFGWSGQNFVSDLEKYSKTSVIEGKSCIEWRQGVKTDALPVMVFSVDEGGVLINGLGEAVDIESELVFPFVKGSRLRERVVHDSRQAVLVTQTHLGDDTAEIAARLPKTWDYLVTHGNVLDGRKSRIYRGKPRFSIFGVGGYSFKPYKIAVASMYKEPSFSFIYPVNGKPVMLDDTSYFIGIDDIHDAIVVHALLTQKMVADFLDSIVFKDGKRVYTKDMLMRVDLSRMLGMTREDELIYSVSSIQEELAGKGCMMMPSDPRELITKARKWLGLETLESSIQR